MAIEIEEELKKAEEKRREDINSLWGVIKDQQREITQLREQAAYIGLTLIKEFGTREAERLVRLANGR